MACFHLMNQGLHIQKKKYKKELTYSDVRHLNILYRTDLSLTRFDSKTVMEYLFLNKSLCIVHKLLTMALLSEIKLT